MSERDIDWRAWVNRLQPCYSCGKLGLPPRGHAIPTGWKVLYQPHSDGKPGLSVCSSKCQEAVTEAMKTGPVLEPLGMPTGVVLPAEVMQSIRLEIEEAMDEEKKDGEKPVLRLLEPIADQVPIESIHPIKRLGTFVRRSRVKAGLSLREAAEKMDRCLEGNGAFNAVVLGHIERSVRPPDSAEVVAIAEVLGMGVQTISDMTALWSAALWDKSGTEVAETSIGMRTVPAIPYERIVDELANLKGIMSSGVSTLEACGQMISGAFPDLAREATTTANVLRNAVFRVETILHPDLFAEGDEKE
jgi:transcriptional regulator with XRE-family HTH domain